MARIFLAIPATSTSSERLFSDAGNLLTSKRSRIDSELFKRMILRDDMKEERRNNEVHASQRSAGLHSKIESVRSELTDKIDDMPNRIIDQLSKLNLLRKPHDDR